MKFHTYTIGFIVWGYRMKVEIKALNRAIALVKFVDKVCTYDEVVSLTRH